MSIISEALKRAESDRARKQTMEQMQATEPITKTIPSRTETVPPVLEQTETFLEEELNERAPAASQRQTFSVWVSYHSRDLLIFSSIIVTCLFILSLLVKWPTNQQAASFGNLPGNPVYQDKSSAFQISGISVSNGENYAIINGKVLRVGESVDGASLKSIQSDEVILETSTGEIRLAIPS